MNRAWILAGLCSLSFGGVAEALPAPRLPATACVVVSGRLREGSTGPFGAHHPWLAQNSVRAGGMNCAIVRSWDELSVHAEALPPGQPLLILQGAHGQLDRASQEVQFHCDRKSISGREVLNALERLSRDRPVAAALASCYSSQVLLEKLIRDEQRDPHDARVRNLCLSTASVFARPAHVGENDFLANLEERARDGVSMNQFYLSARSGLISSAPWSESGLPSLVTSWRKSRALPQESQMKKLGEVIRLHSDASDIEAQRSAGWAFFESKLRTSAWEYLKQARSYEQVQPLLRNDPNAETFERRKLRFRAILGEAKDLDFSPMDEPGSRSLVNSDDGFQSVSLPAAVVGFSRGGVIGRNHSHHSLDQVRMNACRNFVFRS